MKNKKWILAAVVLLLVAVLLIWRPWSANKPAEAGDEPVAESGVEPEDPNEPAAETGTVQVDPEAGEVEPEETPTMLDPGEPEGTIELAEGDEQGGL